MREKFFKNSKLRFLNSLVKNWTVCKHSDSPCSKTGYILCCRYDLGVADDKNVLNHVYRDTEVSNIFSLWHFNCLKAVNAF